MLCRFILDYTSHYLCQILNILATKRKYKTEIRPKYHLNKKSLTSQRISPTCLDIVILHSFIYFNFTYLLTYLCWFFGFPPIFNVAAPCVKNSFAKLEAHFLTTRRKCNKFEKLLVPFSFEQISRNKGYSVRLNVISRICSDQKLVSTKLKLNHTHRRPNNQLVLACQLSAYLFQYFPLWGNLRNPTASGYWLPWVITTSYIHPKIHYSF